MRETLNRSLLTEAKWTGKRLNYFKIFFGKISEKLRKFLKILGIKFIIQVQLNTLFSLLRVPRTDLHKSESDRLTLTRPRSRTVRGRT